MQIENITFIGTSHIAKESVITIQQSIEKLKPDVVCVELDKGRLYALEHDIESKVSLKDIPKIGFQGYLFTLIGGYIQRKLGNVVGIKPGSDMLAAVESAKEKEIPVVLIDQEIQKTLRRFSQCFTFRDKMRIIGDMFRGIFIKSERVQIDLRKVPDEKLIKRLIGMIKDRYPGIYKALIHERNVHMAKQIIHIKKRYPDKKILVVVGAGHKEGIVEILKKTIDLEKEKKDKNSYSFTYPIT